jgi:hypothetical protein
VSDTWLHVFGKTEYRVVAHYASDASQSRLHPVEIISMFDYTPDQPRTWRQVAQDITPLREICRGGCTVLGKLEGEHPATNFLGAGDATVAICAGIVGPWNQNNEARPCAEIMLAHSQRNNLPAFPWDSAESESVRFYGVAPSTIVHVYISDTQFAALGTWKPS